MITYYTIRNSTDHKNFLVHSCEYVCTVIQDCDVNK